MSASESERFFLSLCHAREPLRKCFVWPSPYGVCLQTKDCGGLAKPGYLQNGPLSIALDMDWIISVDIRGCRGYPSAIEDIFSQAAREILSYFR